MLLFEFPASHLDLDGDKDVTLVKYDEVVDLLTRIKDICEEHRGDENYFPNGRLKEVIRLIDGEI